MPSEEEAEIQSEAEKVGKESKVHNPLRHPFKYPTDRVYRYGLSLQDVFGNNYTAPQNYRYIDNVRILHQLNLLVGAEKK